MITTNTFEAERKTSNLSGVEIDTNITRQQQQLRSGITNANEQLANSISTINRNTLPPIFIKDIIRYLFYIESNLC